MISLREIYEARDRISQMITKTPVLHSTSISAEFGNSLFIKAEHLQKTGSFKLRGAANKVKQAAEQGATYVIAASSGNHGQAVAYVAKQLGIRSTIVVPVDTAQCKLDAIQAYGGQIVWCGTTSEERIERAKEICLEEGAVFIAPYDDPMIMAGQGTAGLEILEQVEDIDVVYVPMGGGGLISGVATAIKESNPSIRVIGVEPELACDSFLSFQRGERIKRGPSTTIADGLRTSTPGALTFPIVQRYVDEIVLVDEEHIKAAFTLVLTRMKQLIEPSGIVSIAAALACREKGKRLVSLASGGNVDLGVIPQLFI